MRFIVVGLVIGGLLISIAGADARQPPKVPSHPASKSITFADIRHMLPSGKLRVDIMAMQFSSRLPPLSLKIREGLAAHPDWFRAHQAEFNKPNQPPPYHPNLGLTKPEYAEFVAIMNKGPQMVKVADGTVVVNSNGTVISLEGQTALSFLTKVRIDLAANQVTTPYGILKTVEIVKPNAKQPGGRWDGITWKHETGPRLPAFSAPLTASAVNLTVGKYWGGKRGILIYTASKIEQGQSEVENMVMLDFDIVR